jgi:twitching motility protein PilJ
MEESTRGVVEGARLSDAAGQALAEIGEVSRALTDLIENISGATRQAADSATKVARKMQEILLVTGRRPPVRRKQRQQLANWPVWRRN